jgi:GNAT superfamily N-acetyltransferase
LTPLQVKIRPVRRGDEREALRMRRLLWPHVDEADHRRDIEAYVVGSPHAVLLVAERDDGGLCGFAELGTRSYVDGCEMPSPAGVGFLEGWWVDPDRRRSNVGRALVREGERWARELGCVEMGSDALLGNEVSRIAHLAIGFEETGRVVQFRKALDAAAPVRIHAPVPARLATEGHIAADVGFDPEAEQVTLLAVGGGTRVERIVSRGHASPLGLWYDQDEDEWVMLVAGAARLEIEGSGEVELQPGSWIDLPRHRRHRVAWTDPERDTIWLAVFRR